MRCDARCEFSRQAAYQILVATDRNLLTPQAADLWDSGYVEDERSLNVVYDGKPLASRDRCYWTVRVWNSRGEATAFGTPAVFELGLLHSDDWSAAWIAAPWDGRVEAPLFRRSVEIEKPISRARLYICGLGYYHLSINGRKVGDHVLDPGWTDYSRRVLYVTYNVGEYLDDGRNALGVMLGNGWRWNPGFASKEYQSRAAGQPILLLQLEIVYRDGTTNRVVTGENTGWLVGHGPITRNSIYRGESYDARDERDGWDTPGYRTSAHEWTEPIPAPAPGGRLVAQTIEPIRVVGDIEARTITPVGQGTHVVDYGQNFAGWVRLRVDGPRGTTITMKHAETLNDDGTVNQENLRMEDVHDTYVLKGGIVETYEPRFTYHGFRFVEISGYPGTPDLDDVTGRVVRSAVQRAGAFECGNELINRIHRNVTWTEASNLHSVPTDCPQRNERAGWLNDATVRAEESIYNFDMSRLLAKWMDDIADAQDPSTGAITNTAPDIMPVIPGFWEHTHADAVCSCYILVPWLLYLHYDDRRTLEKHYEGMKLWAGFLASKADGSIVRFSQMGDWASPAAYCVPESVGSGAVSAITPGELVSTGFHFLNQELLSRIAGVLGKDGDARRFAESAQRVKNAFNREFLDEERGCYATGSQACNALAAHFGLVPRRNRETVINHIVQDVMENHHGHLTTGNLCSKFLMEALTAAGRADVALVLATQETYPSWGYMVREGATTVWERWEKSTGNGMNSHNHPMHGSFDSWLYSFLGGIRPDPDAPGFSRFIVEPCLLEELGHVRCRLETVRGRIVSEWRQTDEGFELSVEVPFNTTAKVSIRGHEGCAGTLSLVAEPGKHVYQICNNSRTITRVSTPDEEYSLP